PGSSCRIARQSCWSSHACKIASRSSRPRWRRPTVQPWTACWLRRRGSVMLWEVTITPNRGHDRESDRVREEYNLLTHSAHGRELITGHARGYLLEGDLTAEQVQRLLQDLLLDPVTESGTSQRLGESVPVREACVTVLLKPGVMDPVAQSVVE